MIVSFAVDKGMPILHAADDLYSELLRREGSWANRRYDEAFKDLDLEYVRGFIRNGAFPKRAEGMFIRSAYRRSAKETLGAYEEWQRRRLGGEVGEGIREAKERYGELRKEELKRWKENWSPKLGDYVFDHGRYKWQAIRHGAGVFFVNGTSFARRERRRIRERLKRQLRKPRK
jgi:hypothetical protein